LFTNAPTRTFALVASLNRVNNANLATMNANQGVGWCVVIARLLTPTTSRLAGNASLTTHWLHS